MRTTTGTLVAMPTRKRDKHVIELVLRYHFVFFGSLERKYTPKKKKKTKRRGARPTGSAMDLGSVRFVRLREASLLRVVLAGGGASSTSLCRVRFCVAVHNRSSIAVQD